MFGRDVKISKGLNRLISSESSNHFSNYPNVFLDDPAYRSSYFEMFSKAQVVEIANSKYPRL